MKLAITKWFAFAAVLSLLSGTTELLAQGVTAAGISGSVRSRSGEALPGANVVAVHVPSGTIYGTTTQDNGAYNLPGLRVGGPYTLSISFVGYAKQELTDIYLQLSQNVRQDIVLSEQAIQTGEVVVTAERSAVMSASRTGAATNVVREQIDRLPTISRSFQDYYKLSPYFTGVGNSAGGRNNRYNNIQIDGANFNDMFGLGATGTPGGQGGTTPISLEAIEEFQIVVSPFDVRQSNFTGAGINAITRSGTNTFTGSAFYNTRNENFSGKSPDAAAKKLPPFTNNSYGVRIGGPIIENQLFFFGAGEFARADAPFTRTFNQLTYGTDSFTAYEDSLTILSNFLKTRYGYETGGWKSISRPDESDKIFLRFDYNLGESQKLTARWNYLNAVTHNSPSRFRGSQDIFSENAAYDLRNKTNSIAVQLTSLFGNTASNELIVGYNNQLDQPVYKGKPFPTVEIRTRSAQPGANTSDNRLAVGSEEFRHQNELEQNVVEITDNFSWYLQDHTVTFGAKLDFIKFRNLFIPDNFGFYLYNTIGEFMAGGSPASYAFRYSATADPLQEANWGYRQFGFYVQDEWTVNSTLRIVGGIRFDLPTYTDNPNNNANFESTFGLKTSEPPKSSVAISPRIGFNWAVDEERNTQVRGGVGVFYGRFPAVWVSNQYSNTGVDFYTVATRPSNFIADPYGQPKIATGLPTAEVNITDPDFKAPSILRFNIAVDHKLPFNLVASLEGIFSKSQNEVYYENINLAGVKSRLAGENREVWSAINTDGTYSSTGRTKDTRFTAVYLVTNTDQGSNANIIAQIQRQSTEDGLYANVGYTWGSAKDIGGTNSTTASSGWRFNYSQGNPNSPELSYADGDRRHRIFGTVSYRYEWDWSGLATTVGLFYNGLSGLGFSYRITGDVNGDGLSDNDLAYIPRSASDIVLVTSAGAPAPQSDYDAMMAFINGDPYLSENKGMIAERNGAVAPWTNQWDLRITQEIPSFMGQKLEITFDVTNLTNLLNKDWGWIPLVTQSNVALMTFHSVATSTNDPANVGKARYRWTGNPTISSPSNTASRWTAQFGVRYTF
ncbi:MAG: carboxypeptidase regulatory-like domain-containing protein [Bacteroidota bacterium]